jgi:hypothetical protein
VPEANGARRAPTTRPTYIKELNMSLSKSFGRARYAAAIALTSIVFGGGPAAAAPAPAFDDAMQHYQDGRWAAAYGRFAALADRGDNESARIALLMLRHGERLYGSKWSATQEQIRRWSVLAIQALPTLVADGAD